MSLPTTTEEQSLVGSYRFALNVGCFTRHDNFVRIYDLILKPDLSYVCLNRSIHQNPQSGPPTSTYSRTSGSWKVGIKGESTEAVFLDGEAFVQVNVLDRSNHDSSLETFEEANLEEHFSTFDPGLYSANRWSYNQSMDFAKGVFDDC